MSTPTLQPLDPIIAGKPAWYAAYTRSKFEKQVARELEKQGIEYYLPLYTTIRQWSDRKKKVVVPLIRSYIFVHIVEKEYLPVLQTTGIVTVVKFCGKPVPIPEWQIKNLKILLGASVTFVEDDRGFEKGEKVTITQGVLQGLRGTITRIGGHHKIIISIHALNFNVTLDIDPAFVEPIT